VAFDNMVFAFLLTLFAGLATGIGSTIAFFAKTTNTRFLSAALGFSAGVMLYVSFVEIFEKARISLIEQHGEQTGYIIVTLAFFGGMLFIALIDQLVPEYQNPHELRGVEEMCDPRLCDGSLMRMGLFSAGAIAIHNFPEGLATFVAAMADPQLGIAIAVAIAIHNIPEGIAISVPIYYATKSRAKAFKYSFLSGLAEPLGALAGVLLLKYFFNESIFGILFASVAGIMVFISLDELLPAAQKYGEHHTAIYGLIAGMVVMAVSLVILS
jgi:zinc transporter, ZIP family